MLQERLKVRFFLYVLLIISVPRTDGCTLIKGKETRYFQIPLIPQLLILVTKLILSNLQRFSFVLFNYFDRKHMPLAQPRSIIFSKMKPHQTDPKLCSYFSILFFLYIVVRHVRNIKNTFLWTNSYILITVGYRMLVSQTSCLRKFLKT